MVCTHGALNERRDGLDVARRFSGGDDHEVDVLVLRRIPNSTNVKQVLISLFDLFQVEQSSGVFHAVKRQITTKYDP